MQKYTPEYTNLLARINVKTGPSVLSAFHQIKNPVAPKGHVASLHPLALLCTLKQFVPFLAPQIRASLLLAKLD